MRKIFELTIIIIIASLLSSCSDEIIDRSSNEADSSSQKTNSLKIDTFYEFADENTYNQLIDKLIELNVYTADNLVKSDGFKSYATIYKEFAEKAHSKLSEREYKQLLADYSDIIKIEDDVISPRIDNPLIRNIVNRQGLVKIGSQIHLYKEMEMLISLNGSLEDLFLASETKNDVEGVLRFDYNVDFIKNYVACGSSQTKEIQYGSDRKAKLKCDIIRQYETISYPSACNGEAYCRFRTIAWSEGTPTKKNFWGNWMVYSTTNEIDLKYEAYNFLGQISLVNYHKKDTQDDIGIVHFAVIGQEGYGCWSEQGNYQGVFYWINKNKYKHRGTNDNWAEIQCGAY